jgi:hypothetical protein
MHKLLFVDLFLDYRMLTSADNIDRLLDSYCERILEDGKLPDDVTLVQLVILDADDGDWSKLLELLHLRGVRFEDSRRANLTNDTDISAKSIYAIHLSDLTMTMSFVNNIVLKFRPEDVHNEKIAHDVQELMMSMSRLLIKEIYLTSVKEGMSNDWLRMKALCKIGPKNAHMEYYLSPAWKIGGVNG